LPSHVILLAGILVGFCDLHPYLLRFGLLAASSINIHLVYDTAQCRHEMYTDSVEGLSASELCFSALPIARKPESIVNAEGHDRRNRAIYTPPPPRPY
jgi:hypothetical protein